MLTQPPAPLPPPSPAPAPSWGQAQFSAALLSMLLRRWRRAAARSHRLTG
ncbi:hypothetical protein [Inhella proteolytica]|uniref:Uncharacterized protein n=1 Tax=Inhella proteolytica TaxID=2795029 RepID=A0A931J3B9_9BURK|nr:hypothetical protein [Inhella proteolytica]MBH9576147.1 hypothetical protein [Inhella proteolytica]